MTVNPTPDLGQQHRHLHQEEEEEEEEEEGMAARAECEPRSPEALSVLRSEWVTAVTLDLKTPVAPGEFARELELGAADSDAGSRWGEWESETAWRHALPRSSPLLSPAPSTTVSGTDMVRK
mmetsp:Transcript_28223/g.66856  ORF Transcript_28223/g.66856 Transcript_28223/m.66856 type:complete len:122 (-) Transcript_28223:130-495(-)